jgi:(p)ppGpp synthase/HD superfamily hydrolase
MPPTKLTDRFNRALSYAFHLHSRQTRKGVQTPYVAHLLSVTALVLEAGGDEDLAIAALLHDAVEDQGGMITLKQIRHDYGDRVADIVLGCSDSTSIFKKAPWKERKDGYLAHLATASEDVLKVSLADKLHNARTILLDLRQDGNLVWQRFNGGKEGALWYYRALVDFFDTQRDLTYVDELHRVVEEIEQLAKKENAPM